ncbi:sn-glycerol-3-phosphate ABC transporter ATP-binding protein UgpC [Thioclava sp. BHET1]|nr:sn-glycerol-3-phosphate ABC transporter ATP-binding protein UgpC [Thioclava sp. BHET1]
MTYLMLENVAKRYGAQEVIPALDLAIEPGDFVCLVGPSGSGKSTLLRMIAGLESISGGAIRVEGEDISHMDPSDRDMAMVFQTYALYPHMTVSENISFALRMRGTEASVIDTRVREAIAMLDLTGLENRKPKDLSGGQRQRVAMGRCIVRKPKLFLFDEPLSNLDAKLRTHTRHQIRHLHDQLGATSIFVTHDQIEAMTMADRIALLDHGVIQQIGTPQELYLRPANRFTAGFLGSPEMNFFRGSLSFDAQGARLEGPVSLPLEGEQARLAHLKQTLEPGAEVDLGVRPEHLQIAPEGQQTGAMLKVETLEWLGHEAYVFGTLGGSEIAVRVSGGIPATNRLPRIGDQIGLTVQPDTWHVFDPSSGANLSLA